MFLRKSWLAVLTIAILLMVTAASASAKEIKSPVLRVGLDYRSIETHFSDYSSNYYNNFVHIWETFTLFGIRADMLWRKQLKDQLCLEYGFGLGLFAGSYDYEVDGYTGSGGASVCGEIDAPLRLSYWLSDEFTVFGRLGASLLFITAAEADDPPPGRGMWFYDDVFTEGLPDIYLGLGVEYKFTPTLALSLMPRFTLFGLGAWADYGEDPTDEGYESIGISARLVYEFGR